MTPEQKVLKIADLTKEHFAEYGSKTDDALKSLAAGHWQVASREHPEIQPFKEMYLELVGVKKSGVTS